MARSGTKTTVKTVLSIQLAVTFGVAAASLIFFSSKAAYSALIGGGINLAATAYFAHQVFSAQPGSTSRRMMRAFYWGEVVKIVLTGILFTIVLLWFDVSFLPLFLAYAITMLAFWIALPFTL